MGGGDDRAQMTPRFALRACFRIAFDSGEKLKLLALMTCDHVIVSYSTPRQSQYGPYQYAHDPDTCPTRGSAYLARIASSEVQSALLLRTLPLVRK